MTEKAKVKSQIQKEGSKLVGILAIILLLCPAFLFPKEISDSIRMGIKLCVSNVIPSVFPFFVIADIVFIFSDSLGESLLGKIFSKLFFLPPMAIGAFISGSLCGFPVGVKVTSDLYDKNLLTKKEAERLIAFSNNPSFAFVTSAVGVGMFHNFKIGIILYAIVISSSLITGFIFRQKSHKNLKKMIIQRQKFNFVSSVKNAGLSSITVSSYIIFFSALSGLFLKICGNGIIGLIGVMLSEVAGGVSFISSKPFFGQQTALILTAIALAFSGFSVHLQSRSLAAPELSFIKYYIMKSVQACIAGFLAYLFGTIFI